MPSHKRMSEKHSSSPDAQPLPPQLTTAGKQLNATNVDFLRIDAETALTFSRIALDTQDEEKKERNRKNARKAYDTILRLWDGVIFTPEQEGHIREMLSHLKDDLTRLGENL